MQILKSIIIAFSVVLLATPLNAQAETYTEVFQVPTERGYGELQVADFNRDGNLDILADNFYYVDQYFGKGDGTFTTAARVEYSRGSYQMPATLVDLDSDGILDLLYSQSAYRGNNDGTFSITKQIDIRTRACRSPYVVDIDNDGAKDLVCEYSQFLDPATEFEYGITTLRNYGDANLLFDDTALATIDRDSYMRALVPGDINNDGITDFAIVNNAFLQGTYGTDYYVIASILGTGNDYTFASSFRVEDFHDSDNPWNSNSPTDAVLADINRDENLDLIIAITGVESAPDPFISIHFGDGLGNFSEEGTATSLPSKSVSGIKVGDFDADGKNDLLVAQSDYDSGPGTIIYLPGNNDGSFKAPVTIAPERKNITAIVTADFNNDGKPDIAAQVGHDYTRFIVLTSNNTVEAEGFCIYQSSDPDGDGWGWENGKSCEITELSRSDGTLPQTAAQPATVNTQHPACEAASSDSDGDGWGWENSKSCRVVGAADNVKPACSSASFDSDGDGWGWENGKSCIVQ